MKKENQKNFYPGACFLIAFVLWTVLLRFVDVKQIGPKNSRVGLSTLNQFIPNLTGTSMPLYTITDWLGLIPIAFVLGFGLLGLFQWIKRKHLKNVDYSIFVLGVWLCGCNLRRSYAGACGCNAYLWQDARYGVPDCRRYTGLYAR